MKPSEVNEAIFFHVASCCISLHVCLPECLVGARVCSCRLQRLKKNLNPFGLVGVSHAGNFEVPMQHLQGSPLGMFTTSNVLFTPTRICCSIPVK